MGYLFELFKNLDESSDLGTLDVLPEWRLFIGVIYWAHRDLNLKDDQSYKNKHWYATAHHFFSSDLFLFYCDAFEVPDYFYEQMMRELQQRGVLSG